MNRVDGKIAVVTGGTQGLGKAIAKKFAELGARGIIICGRNKENGRKVINEITSETTIEAEYVEADLAKVQDCQLVIGQADKVFGKIDIL